MKGLLSWTFALAVVAGATNASADWSDDDDDSSGIAAPEPTRLSTSVSGSTVTLTVLLSTAEGPAPRIGDPVWVRREGTDLADASVWTAEDGVVTEDGVQFEVVDENVAAGCVLYSLDGPGSSYTTEYVEVGGASCDTSGGGSHAGGGACSVGGVPASRLGLAAGMLGAGLFTLVVRRRRPS